MLPIVEMEKAGFSTMETNQFLRAWALKMRHPFSTLIIKGTWEQRYTYISSVFNQYYPIVRTCIRHTLSGPQSLVVSCSTLFSRPAQSNASIP